MSIFKPATVVILLLLVEKGAIAQDHLPFTPEAKKITVSHEPWLAPAIGYVPSVSALRLSIISGNILLNRVGGYATIEKGLNSDYFTNIYGVTLSLSKNLYLWGGVDLFTSRGILHSSHGARKEAGIGIFPWKRLAVNAGWSKSVGFTVSVGWKIPVWKD